MHEVVINNQETFYLLAFSISFALKYLEKCVAHEQKVKNKVFHRKNWRALEVLSSVFAVRVGKRRQRRENVEEESG